jgi:hypothetical protein
MPRVPLAVSWSTSEASTSHFPGANTEAQDVSRAHRQPPTFPRWEGAVHCAVRRPRSRKCRCRAHFPRRHFHLAVTEWALVSPDSAEREAVGCWGPGWNAGR